MLQERQAKLLREEIEALLAPLSDFAGLYDLVKEPLIRARRGLAIDAAHDRLWPLLPLMVCEAISGNYEHALPAAAAIQLLKGAAEVFDDIEDADSSDSLLTRYGLAAATNTATTLLVLAEKAIARLKGRGVADSTIVRVVDEVNSYYATACAGQYLDLSLAAGITISEDTYLRVAAMKSASQVECACCIGALLATTEQQFISLFSTFGRNLGMASQVANDIQGITGGSDIMNRRITLPVIYALDQTDGQARSELEAAFRRQCEAAPDPAQIRDLLFGVGAIHYAMIKTEFYKQRARDVLSEAEAAGASVERLKLFLE
jgi:geranylgeranyl pyrophosphate synthase